MENDWVMAIRFRPKQIILKFSGLHKSGFGTLGTTSESPKPLLIASVEYLLHHV